MHAQSWMQTTPVQNKTLHVCLLVHFRAVAGESGVAFISSSASEFIEMYMGLGAGRVRDVFNTVRLRVGGQDESELLELKALV